MKSGWDIHIREREWGGVDLVVFRHREGGGTEAKPDWDLVTHERTQRTYTGAGDACNSARHLINELERKAAR